MPDLPGSLSGAPARWRKPCLRPLFRGLLGAVVAVIAVSLAALPLAAQTGTITGEVQEAGSGAPAGGVQVYLVGTGAGTLTNAAGRYVLPNVPPGTYTVRVEFIG